MAVDKKALLKDVEEHFKLLKKELGLKTALDELDSYFFIRDLVLRSGFVSEQFSTQARWCIADIYNRWAGYLQSLLFPSAGSLISMSESKVLNEFEKKEVSKMLKEAMYFVSRNTLIGLTKNKREEATFIDESVNFWKKSFQPRLTRLMMKINAEWKK
jgi:hypothetical protein